MAERDGRRLGFQDGGCFSRFLKRERINNQTFIIFANLALILTLYIITIYECYKCLVFDSLWFKNLEKQMPLLISFSYDRTGMGQ